MNEPQHPERDEGEGRPRRRARAFFLAFLALQMIVPLTYYLRDDPYDERFAWRMFSNVRMHSCQTSVSERVATNDSVETRPVALYSTVEIHWTGLLRRNRIDVIKGFLEWRCEEEGALEVNLVNRCRTPAREELTPQRYTRDCARGETTLPEELLEALGRTP